VSVKARRRVTGVAVIFVRRDLLKAENTIQG